jgi:hypothetical protein
MRLFMCRRSTGCFVLGCLFLLAARPAHGQEAVAVSLTEPVADDFVPGDSYTIDVQCQGVAKRVRGDFVKATDRWIVLRKISEGRGPDAPKNPLAGSQASLRANIELQTEIFWIPREIATITDWTHAKNPPPTTEVEDDSPPLNTMCRVVAADEDKAVAVRGNLTAISDDSIILSDKQVVYEKQEVPVLGRLPVIGAAFGKVSTATENVRSSIPRESVLCIHIVQSNSDEARGDEAQATEKPSVTTAASPSSRRKVTR